MPSVNEDLQNLDGKWDGSVADKSSSVRDLRPGIYLGTITDWKIEHVGQKKTPALKLEVLIVCKQEPPEKFTSEGNGTYIKNTMFLTANSLPYVARDLQAIGKPIAKASDIPNITFSGVNVKIRVGFQNDIHGVQKDFPDITAMEGCSAMPTSVEQVAAPPPVARPPRVSSTGKPVVPEDDIPF